MTDDAPPPSLPPETWPALPVVTATAGAVTAPTPPIPRHRQRVPQPHGGALSAGGTPGNKGGRPSNAYRLWLTTRLESARHRAAFEAALEDGAHPAFMAATRHAAEYAHGKPVEEVQHGGELTVTFEARRREDQDG